MRRLVDDAPRWGDRIGIGLRPHSAVAGIPASSGLGAAAEFAGNSGAGCRTLLGRNDSGTAPYGLKTQPRRGTLALEIPRAPTTEPTSATPNPSVEDSQLRRMRRGRLAQTVRVRPPTHQETVARSRIPDQNPYGHWADLRGANPCRVGGTFPLARETQHPPTRKSCGARRWNRSEKHG